MAEFRFGQRVMIVKDSKLFDSGTIVSERFVSYGVCEIRVRSDALQGKVVRFRSFEEEGNHWRHHFQDPLAELGKYRFDGRESPYQIEGLN